MADDAEACYYFIHEANVRNAISTQMTIIDKLEKAEDNRYSPDTSDIRHPTGLLQPCCPATALLQGPILGLERLRARA